MFKAAFICLAEYEQKA